MGRLRRFVLVATVTAGILLWLAQPFQLEHDQPIALIGLAAAVISAAIAWTPPLGKRAIVRVLLAGFVSFGSLAFIALANHDMPKLGLASSNSIWVLVIAWLLATGVTAQLVVKDCRPRDVYWGVVLIFGTATPFMAADRGRAEFVVSAVIGILILALVPLLAAAITRAIFRRRLEAPEIPDARSV